MNKRYLTLQQPTLQTSFSIFDLIQNRLFLMCGMLGVVFFGLASLLGGATPHLTSFLWRFDLVLVSIGSTAAFTSFASSTVRIVFGLALFAFNGWLAYRLHANGVSYFLLAAVFFPYLVGYFWATWNDIYLCWYEEQLPIKEKLKAMQETHALGDLRHAYLFKEMPANTSQVAPVQQMAATTLPDDSNSIEFEAESSKVRFADVYGMEEVKTKLREVVKDLSDSAGSGNDKKNGILLHGAPGNAKTMMAKALAGEMELPIISINFGDVASRYIGQVPEQVKKVFNDAREQAPCVLFLDEVDSLMVDRNKIQRGDSDETKTTNIILAETVAMRGSGVVLVAATNYLDRLDPAAIRDGRFDFKVEVTNPDYAARKGIFVQSLKKALSDAGAKVSFNFDQDGLDLALRRWEGFSGARIDSLGKEAAGWLAKHRPARPIEFADLYAITRAVQGNAGKVSADTPSLDALSQSEEVRTELRRIANRMMRMEELEQLGGSLPGGALFGGPARSGKTTAAKALAKTTDWRFVPIAGHEVLADPEALNKAFRKAADLRPCILFIDEADDILRDRRTSNVATITNKFLTLIDGAESKPKDVLVIAATNFPEALDSAVIGGGRLTEKVMFGEAEEDQLLELLDNWKGTLKLKLASDVTDAWLVAELRSLTVGNASALLQAVVDQVASRVLEGGDRLIQRQDVEAAYRKLFPEGL